MVRTRFAPSPTGFLHVGGLRTALYNYLYAAKHKGVFILRIEDTDQKRFVPGAMESLIATLGWAGLPYGEGPYIQSQRFDIYKKHAAQLLETGHAYRCFCRAERLEQMRKKQEEHKQAPRYDRKCAALSTVEIDKLLSQKTPFVIRYKVPDHGEVIFQDQVRGEVRFKNETIDDQVLIKSDGFPTYHLANVVDDHLMEITHVIRGEEWLPSTPKHILLYNAFGWQPPAFAHLPLLLNKDRSKLSKRQGDVAVEDYQKKGYLPETMINFVALLGWHPGGDETQEIFALDELVEKFSLEKVHKAGAVFDLEKLDWLNWQWRRRIFDAQPGTKEEKLRALVDGYIPEEYKDDAEFLTRVLLTVEEKVLKNPQEVMTHIAFYFKEKISIDPTLLYNPKMKVDEEMVRRIVPEVISTLEGSDFTSQEKIKEALLALVTKLGVKNGQVLWPIRVLLTGEQFSPGVFEVAWALGRENTLKRLKDAAKE